MTDDLYARLKELVGSSVEDVYDSILPDVDANGNAWNLTIPVVVVYGVSDTPTNTIDGTVAMRDQRITCEVQARDLRTARTIKEAIIGDRNTPGSGLAGWHGTETQVAQFESGGPELYDLDLNPPRWCLPVDFILII